ncbi:MAG: aminoglycoside phosphotransferase family protein [Candidatus Thorarchaeota archaeon]
MKNPAKRIHGHTIDEIRDLLLSACEPIEKDIVLDESSLGGWSNINIQGTSEGRKIVLKLPWAITHFDSNPYSELGRLLAYLSRSKLATPPIAIGRLPDRNETPFMLLHYQDGRVHSSLLDASREELQTLKSTLQKLSRQKPPGLREYATPFDYFTKFYDDIMYHNTLSQGSTEVLSLVSTFQEHHARLSPEIETLEKWSRTLMHGDLWEPNILFQDGKVYLLDFEQSSYGDPIYDLAYLLEAQEKPLADKPPDVLYVDCSKRANSYRPVALIALISWSLDRLLYMDAGHVEPSLSTPTIKKNMLRYTRAKMSRLILPTN